MRRTKQIALAMLFMTLIASGVHAQVSNRPLYVDDDNGWKLWSCYNAEEVMDRCPMPWSTAYKHMNKNGPYKYYGFSVIVPAGDQVFISHKTRFVMTYDTDGDLYETISEELFVINYDNAACAVFSDSGIFIPTPHYKAFTTKMPPVVGNTVVFVRFPLTHQPDLIVKCEVEAALYKEGGGR